MSRFDWTYLILRRAYQLGTVWAVFYYASRHEFQAAIVMLVFFVIAWSWN